MKDIGTNFFLVDQNIELPLKRGFDLPCLFGSSIELGENVKNILLEFEQICQHQRGKLFSSEIESLIYGDLSDSDFIWREVLFQLQRVFPKAHHRKLRMFISEFRNEPLLYEIKGLKKIYHDYMQLASISEFDSEGYYSLMLCYYLESIIHRYLILELGYGESGSKLGDERSFLERRGYKELLKDTQNCIQLRFQIAAGLRQIIGSEAVLGLSFYEAFLAYDVGIAEIEGEVFEVQRTSFGQLQLILGQQFRGIPRLTRVPIRKHYRDFFDTETRLEVGQLLNSSPRWREIRSFVGVSEHATQNKIRKVKKSSYEISATLVKALNENNRTTLKMTYIGFALAALEAITEGKLNQ